MLTTHPYNPQFPRGSCLRVRPRPQEPPLWQRDVLVFLLHPQPDERFPTSHVVCETPGVYSLIPMGRQSPCVIAFDTKVSKQANNDSMPGRLSGVIIDNIFVKYSLCLIGKSLWMPHSCVYALSVNVMTRFDFVSLVLPVYHHTNISPMITRLICKASGISGTTDISVRNKR